MFCSGKPLLSMHYNYINLSVALYLMQGENKSRTSQEIHGASFEFELKMN